MAKYWQRVCRHNLKHAFSESMSTDLCLFRSCTVTMSTNNKTTLPLLLQSRSFHDITKLCNGKQTKTKRKSNLHPWRETMTSSWRQRQQQQQQRRRRRWRKRWRSSRRWHSPSLQTLPLRRNPVRFLRPRPIGIRLNLLTQDTSDI